MKRPTWGQFGFETPDDFGKNLLAVFGQRVFLLDDQGKQDPTRLSLKCVLKPYFADKDTVRGPVSQGWMIYIPTLDEDKFDDVNKVWSTEPKPGCDEGWKFRVGPTWVKLVGGWSSQNVVEVE